jgi:hypothetical protein
MFRSLMTIVGHGEPVSATSSWRWACRCPVEAVLAGSGEDEDGEDKCSGDGADLGWCAT